MTQGLSDREIRELASIFGTPEVSLLLWQEAALPSGRNPAFTTAYVFWREVSVTLSHGLAADGRERILAVAAAWYPSNPVFAEAVVKPSVQWAALGRWTPSDSPRSASLFCLDARGYSRNGMLGQLGWRDGLRGILDAALQRTGLSAGLVLLNQDHGDGCLAVLDGQISKGRLASDFVRELRIAQREFNAARTGDRRLRLRMSLHHGDVIIDGTGVAGNDAVIPGRLIDAAKVRCLLERHRDADLVLVLSPEFHRVTVAERLRDLDPGHYSEIDVVVAEKYSGRAFVTLPGHPANPPSCEADGTPRTSTSKPPFPGRSA